MEPIEGSYLHWGGSGAMEGVRSLGEGSMGTGDGVRGLERG